MDQKKTVNKPNSKKKTKKTKLKKVDPAIKAPYTTIKTTLKSVLKNYDKISPKIGELVSEINDITIHTYQFIRLFILKQYNEHNTIPKINEEFILNCMKTLCTKKTCGAKCYEKTKKEKEILSEFYEKEYKNLVNRIKTSITNKEQILQYTTTKILTAYTNNIKEHFIQHILRFINNTTKEITKDKDILHEFKNQVLLCKETNELFNSWKKEYITNILPENIEKNVYYDIKARPFEYLKGMLYMCKMLELKELKLFQAIPLQNNIIPKHIVLDTVSLIQLFCPIDCKKRELSKKVKNNQEFIWNTFLRTGKGIFKKKNYIFNNQIQTDGISCCLLFIRKDIKNKKYGEKVPKFKEEEYRKLKYVKKGEFLDKKIIGCDPGKKNLVYMVDEQRNKLLYSAKQRRKESLSYRNHKILLREKKRNNIIKEETKLSKFNCKTVDYETFKLYLTEKEKLNKKTKDFYDEPTWRKMKFRQYSYGKKSIDKFLNKIKEKFGNNLLIGYGSWSTKKQKKHFMPTMNKGLRKIIHKRYQTISVNEDYTSQKCSKCSKDIEYLKDKNGKEIFRLAKCPNCVSSDNKQTVFWTRDVNSANNMLNLTKIWLNTQTRPEAFIKKTSSTPKKVNAGWSDNVDNNSLMSLTSDCQ
jgi:hypothetical protein